MELSWTLLQSVLPEDKTKGLREDALNLQYLQYTDVFLMRCFITCGDLWKPVIFSTVFAACSLNQILWGIIRPVILRVELFTSDKVLQNVWTYSSGCIILLGFLSTRKILILQDGNCCASDHLPAS